ncbi:hypothetical protein, partial [Nocardioides sp.]|uniref:hypothetical protein n=1 Tax=Nocardioides sp. TaxID=35761 RepID=UPI002721B2BE
MTRPITRRSALAAGAAGAAALALPTSATAAGLRGRGSDVTGRALFSIVEGYSRWPLHRTGSAQEEAAVRWVEQTLRRLGATTSRWRYDYPHYDWSASVRVGRQTIPSVPLYYEGTGRVRTSRPFVAPTNGSAAGEDPGVQAAVAAAKAAGAEVALLPVTKPATATAAAYDGLVAFNSDPDTQDERTGVPTLVVPGRHADAIARHGADVRFTSRVRSAHATNLEGWFGTSAPVADPVVVTTPLSGWFTCAAERGPGLAFALALATDLARTTPVFFLGNTGHELDNVGVRRYLAQELDLSPRAVIHLGASLAAGARDADGRLRLVPRVAASNPAPATVPGLVPHLATGRFAPVATFPGEGAEWSRALGPDVP